RRSRQRLDGQRAHGLPNVLDGQGAYARTDAAQKKEIVPSHPNHAFSPVRHGSQTLKQLPVPGVLVTATAPPCSSAKRDTITRPSPVPSVVRVKLLLICV